MLGSSSKILTIFVKSIFFSRAWSLATFISLGVARRGPSHGRGTAQQATRRTTQLEMSSGQGISDTNLHISTLLSLLCSAFLMDCMIYFKHFMVVNDSDPR